MSKTWADIKGVEPLDWDTDVIRWKECPDCGGRGYFLINPFATGGSNGAGGLET